MENTMNDDTAAPPGRVLLDRSGPVATLMLDNPGKLNAINLAMWGQMIDAMKSVAADQSLRVLVVRGAGAEAFAAGGDLAEFPTRRSTLAQAMDYHERWVAPALDALARCPIPSVAMIHGPCIGGGLEIAACCDIRIAAAEASFGAPILRLGFNMYAGELAHVMRVAGPALVSEILLEGRILDASEALRRGLVGRVFPAAALDSEVAATCGRIAAGAPLVAKAHKAWIRRLSMPAGLTVEEKLASLELVDSEDYREGLAAFIEKRPPDFRGR
jgi:enoyl-CoA hydratase